MGVAPWEIGKWPSLKYGPLVKGLRHRLFTAVTRVRIPYGLYFMEDYPSPAEGNGLENRQACKSVRGFESHILLFNYRGMEQLGSSSGS